jgi:hypothetical protein
MTKIIGSFCDYVNAPRNCARSAVTTNIYGSKYAGDVLRNLQNTSCKIFRISDFNQKSKQLDNFRNALLYGRLSMFDIWR